MPKKKRETTYWHFEVHGKSGTYMKVGRVHNIPDDELPEDIVRYEIKSATPGGSLNYSLTLDEAAALAAGLNLVLQDELVRDSKHVRKRYR